MTIEEELEGIKNAIGENNVWLSHLNKKLEMLINEFAWRKQ